MQIKMNYLNDYCQNFQKAVQGKSLVEKRKQVQGMGNESHSGMGQSEGSININHGEAK